MSLHFLQNEENATKEVYVRLVQTIMMLGQENVRETQYQPFIKPLRIYAYSREETFVFLIFKFKIGFVDFMI